MYNFNLIKLNVELNVYALKLMYFPYISILRLFCVIVAGLSQNELIYSYLKNITNTTIDKITIIDIMLSTIFECYNACYFY